MSEIIPHTEYSFTALEGTPEKIRGMLQNFEALHGRDCKVTLQIKGDPDWPPGIVVVVVEHGTDSEQLSGPLAGALKTMLGAK